MKTLAILQARTNSKRLPGKVLSEVNGVNILTYCIKRIKRSLHIDQLVVATTNKPQDDEIVKISNDNGIKSFRGNEQDVLERFYLTEKKFNGDVVIRLNSDNPLIDPKIIDSLIQKFCDDFKYDYATNILSETYPLGMHVEVFTKKILKWIHYNVKNKEMREHVTPFIYLNENKFKILSIENISNHSKYRLTIDYPEDLEVFKLIMHHAKKKWIDIECRDIINILDNNPYIGEINSKFLRKQALK